ncbi:MAG: TIGR01777 family protein [Ferruginibacter sp.]|nr:TIGR01777 family protein [Ferruginibacter sp.]
MKKKKIVIAGGTGFIGKYLAGKFEVMDYEVLIISRNVTHINWEDEKGMIDALENSDMLINLAGKSVDCRYTQKNKKEILLSRTGTTVKLGEAILRCKNPPVLWINSGTATIYRHAEDRPMTETKGEIGKGFSVDVATAWEKTFFSFKLPKTRMVVLRMAIVLGKNGGVINPLTNLVRFGLGGKQGKGTQMFSWIHIVDLYNIIRFIQSQNQLEGIFNCAAPNPVDNKTFMTSLRQKMNIGIGLPSAEWLLNIGAYFINTETELILKSRWVTPERLILSGFCFEYPTIDDALTNIIEKREDVDFKPAY